eukprot:TRINITY_DN25912_c0_g1_i1.p1 TRINITY_DN25912_c0_g1~~TRINITY_DN25912_c0_g1_i1.p1  ORF type:complete len:316 (+),score=61.44 TRINITY_DN25912_c0_g1_i1:167-1114(+)
MVSSGIAWVLVGIAILVWGSFIIPVKLKAVQEAQLHPLVFQTYMGLAIAPSSLIVWAWEKPSWTWWGFAGAGLWVMGNTCAIGAVKRLGIGTAQGIWAGGICVISFLWGFLARPLWADGTCTITDVPLAIIGLVVVVVGIVGLSVVSSAFAKQDNSGDKDTLETLIGDELPASEEPNPILSSEAGSKTTVSGPGTIPRSTSSGSLVSLGAVEFDPVKLETLSKPRLVGSVLAIITSLFGGSCLVPVKLAPDSIQAGYAVPFGIGTVVVSGGMCLVYTCLLYTSDAADEEDSVDLGGRRIIKKKKKTEKLVLRIYI